MTALVIRALLAARYLTFAVVAILFVALAWSGERVTYVQSINSFFAEDDRYMAVYQQAARTFGDDNLAFLVYEDPELLTTRGMDRVAELAESVGPAHVPAAQRVESIDTVPLVWAIDDALLALDRLPAIARKFAKNAAKSTIKNIDLKTSAMTVAGAVRAAGANPAALERAQGSPDAAPPVPGFADRRGRHDHRRGGAVAQDSRAQRDRYDDAAAAAGRRVRGSGTGCAGPRSSGRRCSWPTDSPRSKLTAAG